MDKTELQAKLDELGIVSISAAGELSSGLVNDAIASTEKLLGTLDLDSLAEEINSAEKACSLL